MRRFLGTALALYLICFAGMVFMRHAFVFPFDDTPERPVGIAGMVVEKLPGPVELEVWVKRPRGNAPVVLLFGGNAGRLYPLIPRMQELTARGFGIAAMGYRGASGRPGAPSEAGFFADAERVYAALDDLMGAEITPERRFAYGISMGTGVAADLATHVPLGGLVLEMPYTRMCDVAFDHYPVFPTCLGMFDMRFDTIGKIGGINAPLLVMHGTADRVIPFAHGERVFAAANEPKRFVRYEGGRHHDLRLYGAVQEILKFVGEQR